MKFHDGPVTTVVVATLDCSCERRWQIRVTSPGDAAEECCQATILALRDILRARPHAPTRPPDA